MTALTQPRFTKRYKLVTEEKAGGATYTPALLADFVADQIVRAAIFPSANVPIRVLDPAVGDGALLFSLLNALRAKTQAPVSVYGFDTNQTALDNTFKRLAGVYSDVEFYLELGDFLAYAYCNGPNLSLFEDTDRQSFDLIIANPPYVRTQIMGAQHAQRLATAFDLTGRVDLYHAFLIGMANVLRTGGTAGIIVSNRFMTTRGGASVRAALRDRFELRHIWDLGDTKIFDAAVLPAVILANGRHGQVPVPIRFSSIYETTDSTVITATDPINAMAHDGAVALDDGRRFNVQHGTLHSADAHDAVWRIATKDGDEWLATVKANSSGRFRDIGKIRVGVKTCADKIFIRSDWPDRPELLRPLTTHHDAGRFRAIPPKKPQWILYPHVIENDRRRAANLDLHPRSKAYLDAHRHALESRSYVTEGGREWYEIWVPQDPAAWDAPKLVFRDISARPTFWIDLDGTVVNGDCYWMIAEKPESQDLLWLAAAVANSTFSEAFYDHLFNNKLYSGRRRYMSQYVEQFPLPDPAASSPRDIITAAKRIYEVTHTEEAKILEVQIDRMVWNAFGLPFKEATW